MIKDEIGYNLEVISGEKEADLIFKGVTLDFNFNNYIIIDIGGGSTEFIWQNFKDDEINMKSIDIGAVRITDRFINDVNIPLSRSKVEKISTHIRKTFKENIEISSDINNLIGVGGTITTLASIMLKLESYNSKAIHNYILKYSDINKIMNILRKLDLKMKKKIKGLDPDRDDIIVPGTIILIETMKYLRKLKLRVSDYDILHGMLID
jgi:exopolyphosphatase/guanosine-5'-triphosphate,3'-diphosphate pyrophosphatase